MNNNSKNTPILAFSVSIPSNHPFQFIGNKRYFSSDNSPSDPSSLPPPPSIDPSTTSSSSSSVLDSLSTTIDSQLTDAATTVATATTPEAPGFVISQVMTGIEHIHQFLDIPYWGAIVVATVAIRTLILPIAIKTIQGSARMAHLRPHLQNLQERMAKDEAALENLEVKLRYQKEAQALFKKYDVNPLRAMMWPFAQFPIFLSFFFALQSMGTYYPGMATGGAFWFENLAAADPTWMMPILNSLSFLIMIELGQDGVAVEQQQKFKMILRGLAIFMVPMTLNMPNAVFVYWGTSNLYSIIQTSIMKNPGVRKMLNIPDLPKPEDNPNPVKIKSPFQTIKELIDAERSKGANAKAEIIEGKSRPAPPAGPPPVTFAAPPKKANPTKKTVAAAPTATTKEEEKKN